MEREPKTHTEMNNARTPFGRELRVTLPPQPLSYEPETWLERYDRALRYYHDRKWPYWPLMALPELAMLIGGIAGLVWLVWDYLTLDTARAVLYYIELRWLFG